MVFLKLLVRRLLSTWLFFLNEHSLENLRMLIFSRYFQNASDSYTLKKLIHLNLMSFFKMLMLLDKFFQIQLISSILKNSTSGIILCLAQNSTIFFIASGPPTGLADTEFCPLSMWNIVIFKGSGNSPRK